MDYLVMRLYAPLSSWGAVAIGEERPTVDHPTRGAIIGLLSAALGIKRCDDNQLKALADRIGMASKTYSNGTILRDYHTIQTTAVAKGQRFYTRKQELQSAKLETILSSRDYREDGLWMVAIWLKPKNENDTVQHDFEFDLTQLQSALKHPKFTLYLGRKSCPLAMPLLPSIINADSIKQALDTHIDGLLPNDAQHTPDRRINELVYKTVSDYWLPTTLTYIETNNDADTNTANGQTDRDTNVVSMRYRQVGYHWEGDRDAMFEDEQIPEHILKQILTHRHWDDPIDRSQWQFTQRIGHEWITFEPLVQPTDSTMPTDITMDKTL